MPSTLSLPAVVDNSVQINGPNHKLIYIHPTASNGLMFLA